MGTKRTNNKTKKINSLTGGKIDDLFIDGDIKRNQFVTMDRIHIGNYDMGWWYVKNGLMVCNDYPHGVAEVYKLDRLVGYLGFTHRGGNFFIIGDRLFEADYEPKKEDYTREQWKQFINVYNNAIKTGDTDLQSMKSIIPFTLRGDKTITDFVDCKQAAINLSQYLS